MEWIIKTEQTHWTKQHHTNGTNSSNEPKPYKSNSKPFYRAECKNGTQEKTAFFWGHSHCWTIVLRRWNVKFLLTATVHRHSNETTSLTQDMFVFYLPTNSYTAIVVYARLIVNSGSHFHYLRITLPITRKWESCCLSAERRDILECCEKDWRLNA